MADRLNDQAMFFEDKDFIEISNIAKSLL
jgi:hypothetical protein